MQINYLKKDMLIYELKIRGLPADDAKSVEELRSSLRPILQLERKGKPLNYPAYNLPFAEEYDFISKTLNEIMNSLNNIAEDNVRNKFLRLETRLVHLLGRTDRIPVTNLTPEQSGLRLELLTGILSTLDQMDQRSKQDPNLSAVLDQTHANNTDPEASGDDNHSSPSTPKSGQHSQNQPTPSSSSYKTQRVEKWGLKFTGDTKQLSVHNFLERASELRVARGISEKELFESAIDLFSNKALNWFRANRSRFNNWQSLSELLCKHFEPPDYRPRLFREILERTQDPSESIVDYLSSMNALFRRYGSMPAVAQLDIVSRNLSPFYTTQLPVVNSLDELEEECLKLEAKKYRAEHYVPPSRKRHGFVEPDFAFISTDEPLPSASRNAPNNMVNFPAPTSEVVEVRQQPSGHNTSRSVICWNCKKAGHINRQCPDPKKIHCFKCGTPDVTARSCPKCSGNLSRERQ